MSSRPSQPSSAPPFRARPDQSHVLGEAWETAKSIGGALFLMIVIRATVFQPFTIPSSSMEPTLVTGDYIIVSKFAYGWSRASFPFDLPIFPGRIDGRSPARGDVVVFRLPRDPMQTWVKRVIGLPGDRVQITAGTVIINGHPLLQKTVGIGHDHDAPVRQVLEVRESQPTGRTYSTYLAETSEQGDNTGIYVVPAGDYFVMGDNRDNSLDGRWPRDVGVGFLPAENLVGKAEFVLASWKSGSSLLSPWTWLNLQPGRFFRRIR
jgi:signal peptidase I